METLYFENIKYNDLIINNNQTVKILKDNIDFYIHLNLKENNEQLIIFSNGAIDPNKSKPPIFMRHSWHEDFNASCIFIDDRTVHNNNLRIGWGVGSEDRHYLMDYSDIAQMIANTLSIQPENTYYYGSSAGGFMSMYLATLHKDTKAIVNNPQCYVDKYDQTNVNKLYTSIFPDYSTEEIKKKYAIRLSITSLFRQKNYVPEIYYVQNRLCSSDMKNQFNPFCNMLDRYDIDSANIKFILYNNLKSGHAPLQRDGTITLVNRIIEGNQMT